MKTIFSLIAALVTTQAALSQLYIAPGANMHLSGNVQVTLQDIDLVNDGAISAPATGRFIFNGSANNNISGTAVPTFAELEIAKTGSGLLTLQTDINVTDKVVFTSNLVELNNQSIDLGSTGFLEGENENSRITGISGGEVLFATTLNAPSAANPGNLGAVITSAQNLGNTIIKRGHQSQANAGGGGSSIHRYFDIAPTNNTALNGTLRIRYFDAEKNSLDETKFELYKSDDNVNWTNMGYSNRDATLNFAEQTALNDFSRWTLSEQTIVVPVTGLELSGTWKNNAAWLTWVTQTEYNNRRFNIERKYEDGLNFMQVGSKNSSHPNGTSASPTHYSWIDAANANKGPIQYRLQQENLDGKYAYSNIIIIKPDASDLFIVNMYPTITLSNQLYIKTGNRDLKKMQVSIYDMKGSRVFSKELDYQSQWMNLPTLSAGNYKMLIQSKDYRWSGSFVMD